MLVVILKEKQSHFGLVAYVADLLIEPDTSSSSPLFLPLRPLSLLFRDTLESAVRNSTRIDNAPAISRPMGSPSKETWRRKEIETPPSLPPPYGKRKKRPVPVKGMNINRGACRERLTCLPVPTFVSKNVSRAVEYIGLATK